PPCGIGARVEQGRTHLAQLRPRPGNLLQHHPSPSPRGPLNRPFDAGFFRALFYRAFSLARTVFRIQGRRKLLLRLAERLRLSIEEQFRISRSPSGEVRERTGGGRVGTSARDRLRSDPLCKVRTSYRLHQLIN